MYRSLGSGVENESASDSVWIASDYAVIGGRCRQEALRPVYLQTPSTLPATRLASQMKETKTSLLISRLMKVVLHWELRLICLSIDEPNATSIAGRCSTIRLRSVD